MDPVDEKDTKEECQNTEDEARVPRAFKRPDAPTKQELEEHLPTHLPYRSWCPHCGRKGNQQTTRRSWRRPREVRSDYQY